MRNAGLACYFLLAIGSFTSILLQDAAAGTTHTRREALRETAEPYVQITSVTVDPSEIHVNVRPREATVIVQLMARGSLPTDATVRVDVGTYSTDPPGITVRYSRPQTIRLRRKLTTLRFTVASKPAAIKGEVKVAATIYGPGTKGINIEPPDSPETWVAKVDLVNP